jgi:GNAT superfamily N-acetyltransferase
VLANRDLGSRVVIRRRVGSKFTDLLGELVELTETQATVATVNGEVAVPLDEIHRSKRVPDPAGLERAAALAMPAPETVQLGEWLLRAAEGFTGRANSALPLGDPGMPFSAAIAEIESFYRARGLPPYIDVPLPLMRIVARRLGELGWETVCTVLVRVIDLPDLIANTPPGGEVGLSPEPDEQMISMMTGRRGGFPESARHVLTQVPKVRFAGYPEKSLTLSMARGTVTKRWLGYTFVETAPEAQRRGLAREVMGALARWGHGEGATRAFLQVQDNNVAALALYDSLGFAPHHWYTRYTRRG